jgi:hypothetical protein
MAFSTVRLWASCLSTDVTKCARVFSKLSPTAFLFTRVSVFNVSRVAQSEQCLTTDRTAGVRSPTEAQDFSSNPCSQTGCGAHPASCTVGTGGSFPRG